MAVTTEWGKTGSDIDKFTSFLAPNARLSYRGAPAIEGIESIRHGIGPLMKAPGFKMTNGRWRMLWWCVERSRMKARR